MNFYWTEATATWLYIIYYVLTNYDLIIFKNVIYVVLP